MRPFLPKNLICLTSSSSFSTSLSLALLRLCHFSASPHSLSSSDSSHHSRRLDDESRNVRVSVWWDFENCSLPSGVNVSRIAPAITEAVRANGIKGPLQITAFGDVLQLSRPNQEALAYTGIYLSHIPNGGRNSADRSLLVDLMYWVSLNPPPAHLFLISGDKDFAGILHRLRMNNYNILLAVPGRAPDVLCSAATILWQWHSLLKGEDLMGKHFNHPPDGPVGSWYGNNKVPLVNMEINEPTSHAKLGAIPRSVIRRIRHVLRSHPVGITITDLRTELAKCEVALDKHLYGYKKLSRFLLSIPNIQLKPIGDGNFWVSLIPSVSPEPFESNAVPSTTSSVKNEEDHTTTTKLDDECKSMAKDADGTPSTTLLHERSGNEVMDVTNAQLSEIQLPSKENEASKTKTDSLETTSKMLTDNEIVRSDDVSHKIPEEVIMSENYSAGNDYITAGNNGIVNDESGKFKAENKYQKSTGKDADDSVVEEKPGGRAETVSNSSTFFSKIRGWWPFWKSSAKSDDSTSNENMVVTQLEEPKLSELDQIVCDSEESKVLEVDQNVCHSKKPDLFSCSSFWNDMESFVFSSKGSLLLSRSVSREDMTRMLLKDGPLVLRSLSEKGILQLVDVLIAEKKWLDESPSQAFPFRPTHPVQKNSLAGQSLGANGLRSLFLKKTSQSSTQKPFEDDMEKPNQSIPLTRVSTPATEWKCTERSKNDILADCQKLVNEISRVHPDGYNLGCFRGLFAKRYGYHLDVKMLGYQKLASLIQTMPGVKLVSAHIFPSVPAIRDSNQETSLFLKTEVTNANIHAVSNSDSELSDSAPKDDNSDSPWEELGPVSVTESNQGDLESKFSQKSKELLDSSKHPDYEAIDLGYDSSESEEDTSSCFTQPEQEEKPKCNNEQDSSFLQVLELWHVSKEGESSVKKLDNFDDLRNSLVDILDSSSEPTRGTRSKTCLGNYRERQKSHKCYSFVADHPVLPIKDKLIDEIFDGFKKGDDSKMQN